MKHFRPHLLVLFALLIALLCGLNSGLHNWLTDLRFAWTARPASGDIVLVAIDPKSISRIGVWPWPRTTHAGLIDRLEQAGVGDIAFDVDFSAPSQPAADAAFARALQAAGGSVVLPSFRQLRSGTGADVNRPLPAFAANSWSAVVNVAIESDGRVRHYVGGDRIDGEMVPSMAAIVAGSTDLQRSFIIDFGIRSATVPVVSYVDVLDGDAATLRRIAGKKVIIGATALELGDRFSVPNGAVIAGPMLQTLAAESILQNRALQTTSLPGSLAGLAAIALIMLLGWRRLSAARRTGLLLMMAVAIEAIALAVQSRYALVLDTSLMQIVIAVYLAVIALDEISFRGLLNHIAERRFQRITMSLGDGLACADANLAIIMWNPGAEAIFGYSARDVIGQPFDMLLATEKADSAPRVQIRDLPLTSLQAAGGCVIEMNGRRKDGQLFPLEACLSAWEGAEGFNYGAILRDISDRKREAARLLYLAENDTLTGLPNRNTLQRRLADILAGPENSASLLVISIRRLEEITVMRGHGYSEALLRAAAHRLRDMLGDTATLARLDGDEFAVLAEGADRAAAAALGRRCITAFEYPVAVTGREQMIAVSIGVAMLPDDAATVDEALGNAHLAMVPAKTGSEANAVFYEAGFRSELEARAQTEAELVLALATREFELFYQPQVSLADHRVIGAEALIRWRHPERGLVPPMLFMPIVHTSPIARQVAEWVLHSACRQAATWTRAGYPIRIGVNLSPSQFATGDLASDVATVLASTGLPPGQLELEVTEDILLDDAASVHATFRRLQQMGVIVVFDDFGTGYGSLSYLRKFPLDGLKIDRSFVRDLKTSSDDAIIVASTLGLSRQLGLSVIAEGIEDLATADRLAEMGCKEGQGYYFGKPVPAAEFEASFLESAVQQRLPPVDQAI